MKTFLIIEDNLNLQADYKRMLGEEHEYACATTAERAITWLNSMKFDHIICDFQLEQGTGRDVYDWLIENRPGYVRRLTFVCGNPSDVAGLDAPVFQKAGSYLKEALLERVEETSG